MIKIKIRNIHTNKILFKHSGHDNNICETLVAAAKEEVCLKEADLRGANLKNAILSLADLERADLMGADLTEADLAGANLKGADLIAAKLVRTSLIGTDLAKANLKRLDLVGINFRGAYLTEADLVGANLSDANLELVDFAGANLTGADLEDAYLKGADLRRANLTEVDLKKANLKDIKNDFWAILVGYKKVVPGIRKAIIKGEIDGSIYDRCLVGTIANLNNYNYDELLEAIEKSDTRRPVERWFWGIKEGDTPENSQISKITLEWIEEFQGLLHN